jgi:hypothetical protein
VEDAPLSNTTSHPDAVPTNPTPHQGSVLGVLYSSPTVYPRTQPPIQTFHHNSHSDIPVQRQVSELLHYMESDSYWETEAAINKYEEELDEQLKQDTAKKCQEAQEQSCKNQGLPAKPPQKLPDESLEKRFRRLLQSESTIKSNPKNINHTKHQYTHLHCINETPPISTY